jgi:hypothetical protein
LELLGLQGFLVLAGILALIELACARLLVCWVTLFGLVAYDVSLLDQEQSANLTNNNTSDSQTIVSITSKNNTSISNCLSNNPNDPNNPNEINHHDNQGQK